MGLEQRLANLGVVTARLEQVLNWARGNSLWPLFFGLACCGVEVAAAQATRRAVRPGSRHDGSRLGVAGLYRAPRQADLMLVAGRVSRKMAPVLRQLYDHMLDPRWVIAVGDCAVCGGVFNNYAVVQGVDEVLPVDVYVVGCPPHPEALAHGIAQLQDKIRDEKLATWK
jgi:NADH-quinone oxidoreductase subunit B